jgi:hypothetical protein
MDEQIQPPKGTPLFNPWPPEFIADPYPFYHRLRVTDSMHLTPLLRAVMLTSAKSCATNASAKISSAE